MSIANNQFGESFGLTKRTWSRRLARYAALVLLDWRKADGTVELKLVGVQLHDYATEVIGTVPAPSASLRLTGTIGALVVDPAQPQPPS